MGVPSDRSTTPPRTGMRRLIPRWEYRHLHAYGIVRAAAGVVLLSFGVLILSYGSYWWAALFLVLAGLNVAGGCWYLIIARTTPPRT